MKFASKTDIGHQRRSNQDSYAVGELPYGVGWAVVCDGMGGVGGGNIASSTAVKTISDQISSGWRPGMSSNSIRSLLQSALLAANINVFDMSKSVESLAGMGTTVVAVMISDSVAHIVHVGDSRAYIIGSDKKIRLVTRDHSIVQNLIESGHLTEEEARTHPRKNVITRALGVADELDVDYDEIELDEDESVLLCTDGLTNYAETKEINDIFANAPFMEYPERLVELANKNGGGDNITVVVISR